MSVYSNSSSGGIVSKTARLAGIMLLVFFIYAFFKHMTAPPPVYIETPIKAEPYVWPVGCEQREYQEGDHLSRACFVDKYNIKNVGIYRWKSMRYSEYYRVNDQALDIACSAFTNNDCTVYYVVNNAFTDK